MSTTTQAEFALFANQSEAKYGDSETVATVRALIKEIEAEGRMTPRLRVYCSQALKYASIMDQPKSAVAAVQAGVQLTELIEAHMTPAEQEADAVSKLVDLLEGDPFA
ncbi:MAG: hypothetical protein ACTJGT_08550 [Microbacteriaceae bacterium]